MMAQAVLAEHRAAKIIAVILHISTVTYVLYFITHTHAHLVSKTCIAWLMSICYTESVN